MLLDSFQNAQAASSVFDLFVQGGAAFMAVLTVLLAAVCFAAWKAPRWVKEIGIVALVFGAFSMLLGLHQMFGVLQQMDGSISARVIFGGLKVTFIPALYGIIICLIALIIHIVQKPRI